MMRHNLIQYLIYLKEVVAGRHVALRHRPDGVCIIRKAKRRVSPDESYYILDTKSRKKPPVFPMIFIAGFVITVIVVIVYNFNNEISMTPGTSLAAGANLPHKAALPLNIGNIADCLFVIGLPVFGLLVFCQYVLLAQIRDRMHK
jgi:hypothetical protein